MEDIRHTAGRRQSTSYGGHSDRTSLLFTHRWQKGADVVCQVAATGEAQRSTVILCFGTFVLNGFVAHKYCECASDRNK